MKQRLCLEYDSGRKVFMAKREYVEDSPYEQIHYIRVQDKRNGIRLRL